MLTKENVHHYAVYIIETKLILKLFRVYLIKVRTLAKDNILYKSANVIEQIIADFNKKLQLQSITILVNLHHLCNLIDY